MAKKGGESKAGDKSSGGNKSGGKGKGSAKADGDSKDSKAKGAQSINVRHILVSSKSSYTLRSVSQSLTAWKVREARKKGGSAGEAERRGQV